MIDKFVLGIPNFIMAVIVIIMGVMISKSIAKILRVFLSKIKIDRFGEKLNQIEIVYKSGIQIKISTVLSKIIYYFLLLLFLVTATDILGMQALSNLVVSTIEFIPNLVVALIVMILGVLGAEALRSAVLTTCTSLGIPSAKVISMFIFYFVFITVFITALSQAKIDTKFLSQNISIIIAGAVFAFSLGYGLASKDVVANFLASMYSKDRVKVGDVIKINNIEGKVVESDKSSITIATDNSKIIMPINKLMKENIEILN
jgi:hypothetical protein